MKCLQNAHFIALKTLFQKRDRFVDQLGYGQIGGSDNVVVAAVDRKQKLLGMALSDGDRHGGRHFPKQGVCGQNAEGTDDKIRIPAGNKHGIFSGCAEVSPGLLSMAAVAVALVPMAYSSQSGSCSLQRRAVTRLPILPP